MPSIWLDKAEGRDNHSVEREGTNAVLHTDWWDFQTEELCQPSGDENNRKLCQHATFNNASRHAVTTLAIQEKGLWKIMFMRSSLW